eukprot:893343-Pyramimonas_sp.AAC.1
MIGRFVDLNLLRRPAEFVFRPGANDGSQCIMLATPRFVFYWPNTRDVVLYFPVNHRSSQRGQRHQNRV